MAYPPKSAVVGLDDNDPDDKSPKGPPDGPPPGPKPKPAGNSSLYSTAGKSAMEAGQSGLGQEGGDPSMIGLQGMALIQRGIQMVNLAFPDNPGLVATLADVTGRLQTMIPQLVAQSANTGGGMGLLGQMAQGLQGPVGMPQMGAAPMGAPTAPAPMGGSPAGPPSTMMPGQVQYPPVP